MLFNIAIKNLFGALDRMKQSIEKYRSAIILCGGKGSRLGSIGKKLPKTLIKIHSIPILWFIIRNLKNGYRLILIKNIINVHH